MTVDQRFIHQRDAACSVKVGIFPSVGKDPLPRGQHIEYRKHLVEDIMINLFLYCVDIAAKVKALHRFSVYVTKAGTDIALVIMVVFFRRLAQKEGGSVTLRNANSHPDAQQMGLLPVRLPALKTDDL